MREQEVAVEPALARTLRGCGLGLVCRALWHPDELLTVRAYILSSRTEADERGEESRVGQPLDMAMGRTASNQHQTIWFRTLGEVLWPSHHSGAEYDLAEAWRYVLRGLWISARARTVLFVVLGLGAFLRFYGLGAQSLWLDETLTATYVSAPLGEVVLRTFSTNNPPFYYLLPALTVWAAGDSEFWLRFPSAVFSTLSILVAYCLATKLINRRAGLITAFFVSISPFEINYAQEARSYALLYFVVGLSYLLFFQWQAEGRRRDLLLWALTAASLVHVHYLGPIALAVQHVLFLASRQGRERWRQWLAAQSIVALGLLPMVANLMRRTVDQAENLWIPAYHNYPYLLAKTVATVSGMLIYQRYLPELLALAVGLCLPFVRWEDGRIRLRVTSRSLILLTMLLLPFLLLVAHNEVFYPLLTPLTIRYIGFVALPLWMLLALGLARSPRAARLTFIAVLAMSLGINHLAPYYFNHGKINGQAWRPLVAGLCEQATAEDVVVTTRLTEGPFRYYGRCFEGSLLHESFDVGDEPPRVFYVFGSPKWERWQPPAQLPGYEMVEQNGSWFGYRRFDRVSPETRKELSRQGAVGAGPGGS